jgi:hypothetical protein
MWPVRAVAVIALATMPFEQSAAQAPPVTLTQVGSPIWRPVDFQLFSAPGYSDEDFNRTLDALAPLDPRGVTNYTTPHGPPYDAELSTNAVAAGFLNRTVFSREALGANPNAIFFAFMLVPEPGITGSSRDFASGPVIPNSLFPWHFSSEVWKDGALFFDQGEGPEGARPTDQPFDGASHRFSGSSYWNRGANYLGNYEFRLSLIDSQGNGWDIVAPFKVVAELPIPGDFNQDGTVDAADYVVWRDIDNTQDAYDIWRANFGTSLFAGSGSAAFPLGASAEPLSATVPEQFSVTFFGVGYGLFCLGYRRGTQSVRSFQP